MPEPQLPNIETDRRKLLVNKQAELKFLQNYLEYPSASSLGMLAEIKVIDLGVHAVPLLKRALGNKLPESRAFAAKMLGLIGQKDALKEIGKLLNDSNPKVVDAAIGAIGNLQVEDGVELIKPFLNSSDDVTQVTAIRALGNIRGQKSSTVLLEELKRKAKSAENVDLTDIAVALGRSASAEVVKELFKMFASPNSRERIAAITAIGVAPDSDISKLVREFANSKDSLTRLSALQTIGYRRAEEYAEFVNTLLTDPDQRIVGRAVKTLAEIGGDESVENLRKICTGKNTALRNEALTALARIRSEKADKVLEDIYIAGSDRTRYDIVSTLQHAKRVDWVEFFKEELKQTNPTRQSMALHTLEHYLEVNEAPAAVIEVGLQSKGRVKHAAVSLLARRPLSSSADQLHLLLKDEDPIVRIIAAEPLMNREKDAAQILVKAAEQLVLKCNAVKILSLVRV